MDDDEADEAPNSAHERLVDLHQADNANLTDNDNETTNCSETMSTANEDEFPIESNGGSNQLASMTRGCSSPCRTVATRVSVKDRPATPRRHPAIAGDENCDVSALQTFVRKRDGGPNQSVAPPASASAGLTQLDDSTGDTATPSLATLSGIQAPPSYGTAIAGGQVIGFTCATLDAAQLAASVSGSTTTVGDNGNRIYFTLNNRPTPAAQPHANQIYRPLFDSMTGKTIADTMQPSELYGKRQMSSSAQSQEQSRLFSLATNSYHGGQTESNTVPSPIPHPIQLAANSSYLSSVSNSRSLPRFQLAHLNGARGAEIGDDLCRQPEEQHPQRQFNLRLRTPDNNQNAKSNVRHEPQDFHLHRPRLQIFANAVGPINHVISAEGSFQQHSANQYYGTGGRRGAPGAAEVAATAAAAAAGLQSLIPSQSSMEMACKDSGSVGIMDAATVQQQQQFALNMQQQTKPCWPSSVSQPMVANRNQISRSINRYQEVTELAGPPGVKQEFDEHAAQLRHSNESLEATCTTSKLMQVHKKKRRHKSTSGRTVSPQSGRRTAGPSCNQQDGGLRRTTPDHKVVNHRRSLASLLSPTPLNASQSRQRSSERIATVRSRPAISAHCWLVDSSDDQTYAATTNTTKRPSRARKPLAAVSVATTNCSVNTLRSLESEGEQQFGTLQPLTVAMMKQTQRQQAEPNQSNEFCVNGPSLSWSQFFNKSDQTHPETTANRLNDQDLTTNLKTNSLKMEHILSREHRATCRDKSFSLKDSNSFKTVQKKQRRRPTSTSSLETSSETDGHLNATTPASTIMRLSSLLSFASNLARLAPKCLKSHPNSHAPCPAPPNSISGSLSTTSASGQLAAYTNASLAISSSSSTSAYATGSSSAATNSAPIIGLNFSTNQPRCSCAPESPNNMQDGHADEMASISLCISGCGLMEAV